MDQFNQSNDEACSLRLMSLSDVEAVHHLECQCFEDPWTREAFEAECHNHLARYYLVVSKEAIIGYCGLWKVVDEGHITNLCIAPSHRENGRGRWMLEQVFELAKEEGIANITLEVRASNTKAIRLYERLGFVSAGLRKAYYENNGEDALIMWITL